MANLQKLFAQIEELLIEIKPKLKDTTSSSVDAGAVAKDLHQIASLAQSFSDQRFKSGNIDGHLTDALDQQGL